MARKAVVDAVEARLAAHWTRCPVIGINLQGEPPHDASPYLVVQYPIAETARVSLGTAYYREEGAIRFVLHVRRNRGLAEGLSWADELAALFRYQKFDGVECQAPTSPFIDDSNDEGAYFLLSVVAPYTHTFRD